MANTEHIEAKLCAYVDGELDAQGRAEIEQHLASNPQHRALLDELMQQRSLLQSLPRERAPEDLYENFSTQLERSVLLDHEDDGQQHVAGRINRWPQLYAMAAVLVLVVGLAAVIFFILPRGPASGPQFVIGPTTTGPANLVELAPEVDPLRDRSAETELAVKVAPASPSITPAPSVAEATADSMVRSKADAFESKGGATMLAERPRLLNDPFASDLNRHVQTFTKGEVNNPVVVVVSAQNPSAAQSEVTRFLGDNGIAWNPLPEPMPEPLDLRPDQVISRRAQTPQVAMKGGVSAGASARQEQSPAQTAVTSTDSGAVHRKAAPSAAPATVPPGSASGAAGPATQEAIAQDLSITSNTSPSASGMLLSQQQQRVQQVQVQDEAGLMPAQPQLHKQQSHRLILARNVTPSQIADLNARFGDARSGGASGWRFDNQPKAFHGAASDQLVRVNQPTQMPARGMATTTAPVAAAAPERETAAPPAARSQLLAAGDRVEITYSDADRVDVTRVNEEGKLKIPSIESTVQAAGSTPDELSKAIILAYRGAGKPIAGSVAVRALPTATAPAAAQATYAFRSGDVITVHFGYENPDLRYTQEVTVGPDGLIKLASIGEVKAKGETPEKLASVIARAAAKVESGPAIFTCSVRNTAGELISGSAPLPAPNQVAATQPINVAGGERPFKHAAGASTQPVLDKSKSASEAIVPEFTVEPTVPLVTAVATTAPSPAQPATQGGAEERLDVVIVVQGEELGVEESAASPTTMPTGQTLELANPPAATTQP